jgi:ring-1,2-phenylacetyl-CoA epoxidase subunit PaaC
VSATTSAQSVAARSRAAPPPTGASLDDALLTLVLRQADSPLVLAQRLCEWIGKAPILEEDIAQTNVGLDLVGQARLWYAYAGEIEARMGRAARGEDDFAFRRDASAFRNVLLVEQPNGDFAHTIVRQFLFDAAQQRSLAALAGSRDTRVAAIAAKAAKEVDYHVERSAEWVVRLGDGTAESHGRMQRALDALWPYAGELFVADAADMALADAGIGVDARTLAAPWRETVDAVLADATLARPADGYVQRGGRDGRHGEHLGHLLCELQFLQRAYPDARW